ncbi:hypothetical protein [Sphingomonas guangdongensis]|nr:hypothetical protein [Sphingomonas guangdongensis]
MAIARDRARGDALGWSHGAYAFNRISDRDRVHLVHELMQAWHAGTALDREVVAGAFRQAWDSEPYLYGFRAGNYFTAAARYGADVSTSRLLEAWASAMMMPDEKAEMAALEFPCTAYRGGTGEPAGVASGTSWTLNPDTARFFANDWPRRWGSTARPVVLSLTVDRSDVLAFFDDRNERELLLSGDVPRAGFEIVEP